MIRAQAAAGRASISASTPGDVSVNDATTSDADATRSAGVAVGGREGASKSSSAAVTPPPPPRTRPAKRASRTTVNAPAARAASSAGVQGVTAKAEGARARAGATATASALGAGVRPPTLQNRDAPGGARGAVRKGPALPLAT